MQRLAIVFLCALAAFGCAARDTTPKPTAASAGASVADRIAVIQNNPNIPPDAKARAISALQNGAQTQQQLQAGASKK